MFWVEGPLENGYTGVVFYLFSDQVWIKLVVYRFIDNDFFFYESFKE